MQNREVATSSSLHYRHSAFIQFVQKVLGLHSSPSFPSDNIDSGELDIKSRCTKGVDGKQIAGACVSGRPCAPSGIFGIFGVRVSEFSMVSVESSLQSRCSQQPWEGNASVSQLSNKSGRRRVLQLVLQRGTMWLFPGGCRYQTRPATYSFFFTITWSQKHRNTLKESKSTTKASYFSHNKKHYHFL